MKNKGIWFVMAGIVAVGIIITICNSLMLQKRSEFPGAAASYMAVEDAETVVETDILPEAELAGGGAETGAVSPAEEVLPKATQHQVISPLETAAAEAAAPHKKSEAADEYAVSYRARLDELDLQIQKIRSEETESTTYSMKTAAENELKLWDSELNNIYNDIQNHLDEEQTEELVAEEREWMKERDAKAVEAAKKSAGGTLEGLEYTASLAESTRERAYELADLYEQVVD